MLSPLGFDTDVITDEAAIDAFAATDTLCTFTVGATWFVVVSVTVYDAEDTVVELNTSK
jgi:hypothetical protein